MAGEAGNEIDGPIGYGGRRKQCGGRTALGALRAMDGTEALCPAEGAGDLNNALDERPQQGR